MKKEEQVKARALRKRGHSIGDIAKQLNVSRGSVSLWVRDIHLTEIQKAQLTANGFSKSAIEKRRINRMSKRKKAHLEVFQEAQNEVDRLSKKDLWLLGVALYWGEGSKTYKGVVSISNSDPAVIKIMMRFYREILNVSEERIRCHVHTFSHLNSKVAEQYWSGITGVPLKQFYKTYSKPSKAGKGKKDTLPYGTVAVDVCDTKLLLRMMGWIEGLKPKDMCSIPPHLV